MSSISRRKFIQKIVPVGTALVLPATFHIQTSHSQSPNDEIGFGIIGMGWRGGQLADSVKHQRGVRITAVADPDETRVNQAARSNNAEAYTDFRHLLENPDVDAVAISTCNHWHCLAAILAMQAGKDVYVEKPLSHTQWEGRQVVNAARKYNRIVQLGTQQRSDPLQAEARQFLHEEKALGAIHYVQANRLGVREPIGKRSTPLPIPDSIDYELWLGPAQDEEIFRNELHYDWHWDFNTGNGEMGNWGVHILDDVRNVVYQDSIKLPKRILAVGGRIAWNDAGDTPNVIFACLDTNTIPTIVVLSNLTASPTQNRNWNAPAGRSFTGPSSGYVAACEGGYYLGQRGSGKAIDLDGKEIRSFKGGDRMGQHLKNFFDAVRAQDKSILNAEIETGHYSTGWCNLTNVAYQTGSEFSRSTAESILPDLDVWGELLINLETQLAQFNIDINDPAIKMSPILTHDPQSEKFVGEHADQANQYLKREYRKPFVVSKITTDVKTSAVY